jgi:hypothetical protein
MFRVRFSFLFALQLLPGQEREVLEVHGKDFHAMYYIIAWIQIFSIPVFLAGQTTCIFAYDWTVKNGLQESGAEVGPSLVQVNRAYGVSDTILYIPLLASSAYGLFRKKAVVLDLHCSFWGHTFLLVPNDRVLFCIPAQRGRVRLQTGTWNMDVCPVLYGLWNPCLDLSLPLLGCPF